MKKLLGIMVLGYRIMWDNSTHTRHKRDKSNGLYSYLLIAFNHEKTFRNSGFGSFAFKQSLS